MLTLLPLLSLAPFATVPLAGCVECYSVQCATCPPAIAVTVRGATSGLVLDDVEVTTTKDGVAAWVRCAVGAVDVRCTVDDGGGHSVGRYQVTVAAAGWQSETREVVVAAVDHEGCCDCGYEQVEARFELRR